MVPRISFTIFTVRNATVLGIFRVPCYCDLFGVERGSAYVELKLIGVVRVLSVSFIIKIAISLFHFSKVCNS